MTDKIQLKNLHYDRPKPGSEDVVVYSQHPGETKLRYVGVFPSSGYMVQGVEIHDKTRFYIALADLPRAVLPFLEKPAPSPLEAAHRQALKDWESVGLQSSSFARLIYLRLLFVQDRVGELGFTFSQDIYCSILNESQAT